MKKITLLFLLFCVLSKVPLKAENQVISGKVTDDRNIPLREVTISAPGISFLGKTDGDGSFTLTSDKLPQSLVFNLPGFGEKTVSINQDSVSAVNVKLTSLTNLGYVYKETELITGAVSTISGSKTDKPLVSIIGSLYGQLPGLGIMQNSGEVDKANYNLYIRGVATTTASQASSGAARKVLTLVDGMPTDISLLDPNEIESVSILKDAAATAVYGLRGANGVVLITTKRGIKQKTRISFSVQTATESPTVVRKPVEGDDYARYYNEAYLNDGNALPFYTGEQIAYFHAQNDKYMYPSVDWYGMVVDDATTLTRYNLNMTGGIETAKYFISVGYVSENGIFKPDKAVNTYSTNNSFDRYNFRLNLDLKITKTLDVVFSFNGLFDNKIQAGNADATDIFRALLNTTPVAFPALQKDGIMLGGDNVHANPYAYLNRRAYSNNTVRFFQTSMRFNQNLDFLLKGLNLKVLYAFDSYAKTYINRSKTYASYQLKPDGTYTKYGSDGVMASAANYSNGLRNVNAEFGLDYVKQFGNHNLHTFLTYYYYKYDDSGYIPNENLGLAGVISYDFKKKYVLDVNLNYSGTEQFPEGSRFGFFPAVSAGWIVTNESFLSGKKAVNFLKIRGSYGLRGNDYGLPYFAAIPQYLSGNGTPIGIPPAGQNGFYENLVGNAGITWEKSTMLNGGIEGRFLSDRLSLGFDYFTEERTDVLYPFGSATGTLGIAYPYQNVGIIENKGYELQGQYTEHLGKVTLYVGGNISNSKNKIKYMDESSWPEPYMYRTGGKIDQTFGLVSNGFFSSASEISSSPAQFGTLKPGDIKYVDQNGDNVININDVRAIGKPTIPETFYAFYGGAELFGFDLNVLFQGVDNVSKPISNGIAWAFYNKGNVFPDMLGRWTPATAETANYPRFSTTTNTNNQQVSDFWLKDGSYLRLKSIELGYTGSFKFLQKVAVQSFRIFVNAYNPITWDKVDIIDPELPGDNAYYPVCKAYNIGFKLNF